MPASNKPAYLGIYEKGDSHMAQYVYPAIFRLEDKGMYSVFFPDLEGCYTCGENLAEALSMAEDVLAFTLYDYEKDQRSIPLPSHHSSIQLKKNEFINYILCDTTEYHRRNNNRAVKKTLTIPEWLNEEAVSAGVNFSQILQDALKEKLHTAI